MNTIMYISISTLQPELVNKAHIVYRAWRAIDCSFDVGTNAN